MSGQRHAVTLLPPGGTTGIGSLPHTQLELGLQLALQVDIPYLPQLPAQNPSELMIPAALDGLPGLSFDADGGCTVDLKVFDQHSGGFSDRVESALLGQGLEAFEPSAQACRAFRPFLWEVENRKLALAKAQLAGPATVRWACKTSDGRSAAEHPRLDQQILRLLWVKALALTRALRRAGATPLFFLDEPGLYALQRNDPRHILLLQELKLLTASLQKEGALVGLHCCSNTAWDKILGLGLNLVSVDARLSLDALLEEKEAFRAFVRDEGTLSLGIVPTNLATEYDVPTLVESVEASLRATLPEGLFATVARRVLFTPACGLALRSVQDTERTFEEVKRAQKLWRAKNLPNA